MLELVENLQKAIRDLEQETARMILDGRVKDMEQYKFLMGRLEGYKFVRGVLEDLLSKNPE